MPQARARLRAYRAASMRKALPPVAFLLRLRRAAWLAGVLFSLGAGVARAQDAAPPDGGTVADPAAVFYSPEIVVLAPRGRPVGTSAAATTELTAAELTAAPAQSSDQVLRAVPEVTLPRADSQVLHPTGQGLSLRGIGFGRTLVLLDGVPLNDPFGGWIQWNKVAKSQLGRIEITRGASSNVYGSLAMGGVVQLFTRPVDERRLDLDADFGARDTPHVALSAAAPVGSDVSASASADVYRTNGYVRVAAPMRGPVDEASSYDSQNASLRAGWTHGGWSAVANVTYFRDEASSGTPLTPNRRWSADGSVDLSRQFEQGKLELLAFGGQQRFWNTNSRVDGTRVSEVLALKQDIPVSNAGGSLVWSQRLGERNELVAGLDLRWIRATNDETVFGKTGTFVGTRSSGGRQLVGGVFAAWTGSPVTWLTLGAGLRADGWWNRGESRPVGETETAALPERNETALSPRVSAIARLTEHLALRGAGYAGFRAPNLNELYRGYSSGGVLVTPNPELKSERLVGGEAGLDWELSRVARLSGTVFFDRTSDLIEQVTVDATTRQRRNIADANGAGLELNASYDPMDSLRLHAGYALNVSRIVRFPEDRALEGNALAELPRHSGTFGVSWSRPRWVDLDASVRVEGSAFADDRNTLVLPAYALVDLSVSRKLREEVTVFVSVSNLLDTEVIADRTETLDYLGTPRTFWAGFRVRY